MESSTQVLRHMLDERGVEWTAPESYNGSYDYDTIVGEYWYHEYDGKLTVHGLTPKQAIAATLGRETCKARLYKPEHGMSDCTICECGEINDISANYCNRCGRRIEVAWE